MTQTARERITAAKLEQWGDNAATTAQLVELSQRSNALQAKLDALQAEAQQKLTVKAAPLNASLEAVKREVNKLTVDFQQREAKRNAYIEALEATDSGRDDPA